MKERETARQVGSWFMNTPLALLGYVIRDAGKSMCRLCYHIIYVTSILSSIGVIGSPGRVYEAPVFVNVHDLLRVPRNYIPTCFGVSAERMCNYDTPKTGQTGQP